MKKSLLFVFTLILSVYTFAQEQFATLNHNDSITVFYGIDALASAHDSAVTGDIITLSGGRFNSTTITKAVTIRGAGCVSDSLSSSTHIYYLYFDGPNDSINRPIVEGLEIIEIYTTNYNYSCPIFLKCHITRLQANEYSYWLSPVFVNCEIEQYYHDNNRFRNMRFYNCLIGFYTSETISSTQTINPQFMNCIVNYYNSSNSYNYDGIFTFGLQNSILYGFGRYSAEDYRNYNGANSYYCAGIGNPAYGDYYRTANHLVNFSNWSSIFKTYTGGWNIGQSLELKDDVADTLLGSDSTQIGVYGGLYPWNLDVRNPLIRNLNVGHVVTDEGKLEVEIQLENE